MDIPYKQSKPVRPTPERGLKDAVYNSIIPQTGKTINGDIVNSNMALNKLPPELAALLIPHFMNKFSNQSFGMNPDIPEGPSDIPDQPQPGDMPGIDIMGPQYQWGNGQPDQANFDPSAIFGGNSPDGYNRGNEWDGSGDCSMDNRSQFLGGT